MIFSYAVTLQVRLDWICMNWWSTAIGLTLKFPTNPSFHDILTKSLFCLSFPSLSSIFLSLSFSHFSLYLFSPFLGNYGRFHHCSYKNCKKIVTSNYTISFLLMLTSICHYLYTNILTLFINIQPILVVHIRWNVSFYIVNKSFFTKKKFFTLKKSF